MSEVVSDETVVPPVQVAKTKRGRGPTVARWGVALIHELIGGEDKLYKTPEEAVKAAQEHAAKEPDDMEDLYLVRRIKVTKKVTAILE